MSRVAFVTGAARGMGRAHAVALARTGARVIAVDACADVDTVPYPLATRADLDETVRLAGGGARGAVADVRDIAALEAALGDDVPDVVVANAGVSSYARTWELTEAQWQDVVDINLTGVWKTVKAAVPRMIEAGRGGSIIVVSSIGGLIGMPRISHYVAAKHGITGLAKTLAAELAPYDIRVNSVHPSTVNTPLVDNPAARRMFTGGRDDVEPAAVLAQMNALDTPWLEPEDVAHAVVYLASDGARFVTGTQHVVDAGAMAPLKEPR